MCLADGLCGTAVHYKLTVSVPSTLGEKGTTHTNAPVGKMANVTYWTAVSGGECLKAAFGILNHPAPQHSCKGKVEVCNPHK